MKPPSDRAQNIYRERRERIVESARSIAEAEGWSAVTVRRLATEIGYSQPVLYSHFADGRDGIVATVVVDGYRRLADALSADGENDRRTDRRGERKGSGEGGAGSSAGARGDVGGSGARNGSASPPPGPGTSAARRALIDRYLAFARANPAVYEAMSAMSTTVSFATPDAPQPLRAGFARVLHAVETGDPVADETRAELFWAALNGLTQLSLADRLRPSAEQERRDLLVELFA